MPARGCSSAALLMLVCSPADDRSLMLCRPAGHPSKFSCSVCVRTRESVASGVVTLLILVIPIILYSCLYGHSCHGKWLKEQE